MNRLVFVAIVLLLAGCASERDGITDSADLASSSPIVSNPVSPPSSALLGTAALTSEDQVVYVSLPPGSAPTAVQARIENLRTTGAVSTPVIQGGFDPVAIPAIPGDTLDVALTDANGMVSHSRERVPSRRPPRIVRTSPPKGQNDVPLNAAIVIVFSEPIDPATLTGVSVRLRNGATVIAGQLTFHDVAELFADVLPAATLLPNTEYELTVTRSIKDQDGDPLEAAAVVRFTTTDLAGRIAFESVPQRGNAPSSTIEVMDADGYGRTTLTSDGSTPAWSPDGARIAFSSNRSPNSGLDYSPDLYVMNADGSGVTWLTADGESPAWSPDGRKLAFVKYHDYGSPSQIYVMNADGSGVTRLTNTPFSAQLPSWSPDGRKIVFAGPSSFLDPDAGIYVMNADGTGVARLTSLGYFYPAWSPDGTKIAFIVHRNSGVPGDLVGFDRMFVMNADGSGVTQITDEEGFRPAWSPDGTKLVFAGRLCDRTYGCATGLTVVNADGTRLRRLTYDNISFGPAWTARPARP
jgi:Tol biopolymer transport system component